MLLERNVKGAFAKKAETEPIRTRRAAVQTAFIIAVASQVPNWRTYDPPPERKRCRCVRVTAAVAVFSKGRIYDSCSL